MKILFSSIQLIIRNMTIGIALVALASCSSTRMITGPVEQQISKQVVDVVLHTDNKGNYRSTEKIKDKEIDVKFTNQSHHEIIFRLWLKPKNKPIQEIKNNKFKTVINFIEPRNARTTPFCKKPNRWTDIAPQNLKSKAGKKIKISNNKKTHPDNNCYVYDIVVITPKGKKISIDPRIRIRR
jgi:hypothetical protein